MPPGIMTKFRIAELSGVDKPAQEGARVAIMKRETSMRDYDEVYIAKRDFSDSKRKELAGTGKALPDGSFPIENEEDLHNAVRAIGRAKDESKAKAHIIARAKAMGSTGALPTEWAAKGIDMTTAELKKSLGLPENASEEALANALIAKANASEAEAVKAKEDLEAEKKKAEKAIRKASMTEAEKEHCKGMSDDDADDFMAKPADKRKEAMAKRLEGEETIEFEGQSIRKSAVDPGLFAVIKGQAAHSRPTATRSPRRQSPRPRRRSPRAPTRTSPMSRGRSKNASRFCAASMR